MLDPRRTRRATTTRACGSTTTFATRWPLTRRRKTRAAGGTGFGVTTGVGGEGGAGAGVGAGGGGDPPVGGGGGEAGAVTVSTCVTGAWPASVAETAGVPGWVSAYVTVADDAPAGIETVADGEKLPAADDELNVTVCAESAV